MFKKGFTLVELLAVIAILAIILVIAVPRVQNTIEESKKSSFLSSAKAILRQVEYDKADSGTFTSTSLSTLDIKASETDYDLNNSRVYIQDDELYIDLIGIGKFSGYSVCNVDKSTKTYNYCGAVGTLMASGNMVEDPTADKNLRYSGSSPNNYVTFNDETWRIIGVFNVSNGTTYEKRIKLVRNASLGNYSWDSSASDVNAGLGVNDWTLSDLNTLLNEYYYNGLDSQTCYNGINNATTTCSFSSIALSTTAKNMIEDAIWNLGGNVYSNPSTEPFGLATLGQYNAERGTTVYTGRPISWTGKIGLIYPSDFGYASTDAGCRSDLRSGLTYNGTSYDYTNVNCKINNWLYTSTSYWTISSYSGNARATFIVYSGGDITTSYSGIGSALAEPVRPVIYLKSNVKITDGTGTSSNPYILGT